MGPYDTEEEARDMMEAHSIELGRLDVFCPVIGYNCQPTCGSYTGARVERGAMRNTWVIYPAYCVNPMVTGEINVRQVD